jgi:hypothetical protein
MGSFSLPLSLDVKVNISRPITEIATDLTLICFVAATASFTGVRYYSSLAAVGADFATNTQAYLAAMAFFARSQRPSTLAIAAVTVKKSAKIEGGAITLSTLRAINNGSMSITVNTIPYKLEYLDFSNVGSLQDVVTVLQNAFAANSVPLLINATSTVLEVRTVLQGATALIAQPVSDASEGTFVGDMLGLTTTGLATITAGADTGGTDILDSIAGIAAASKANGMTIYGWILDSSYRDTATQKTMSDWAESQLAFFVACTNSVNAYSPTDTTNIGYYSFTNGRQRTAVIYHDNAQLYPDMSYLALALSVDYSLANSAITLKFKQLDGIATSQLSQTIVSQLKSRNINCYVPMGNNSSVLREGVNGAATWFTDTLVNLDNFQVELQTAIFNAFLRSKKLPYSVVGQTKLVSAIAGICAQYTTNGVFAARDFPASTESGYITKPATDIVPMPVYTASDSDRAARIAPPIQVTCYEAGAMHSVTVNVDVYN